jgi:hypothetical protein
VLLLLKSNNIKEFKIFEQIAACRLLCARAAVLRPLARAGQFAPGECFTGLTRFAARLQGGKVGIVGQTAAAQFFRARSRMAHASIPLRGADANALFERKREARS